MLKNSFKIIARNLVRNSMHTSINVFGLALGITCSLVLYLMISYFSSFDKFREHYDHIYRVYTAADREDGQRVYSPGMPSPFPDVAREEIPELDNGVFIYSKYGKTLVGVEDSINGLNYFEVRGKTVYAEAPYFDIFSTEILSGSKNPLMGPNKVVISLDLANEYFHGKNPIGEIITLDKETPLTVTAVMADPLKNTAFPFTMIISYETIKDAESNSGWRNFERGNQFYALIDSEQNARQANKRLEDVTSKYYGENEYNRIYKFQPLSEIYSDRRLGNYGPFVIGRGEYLMMMLVALFMITTACVNFINLSTAMAIKRSREVGIRKVLGSSRVQLMTQYLGETLFISGLAILISIGFAEILLVKLNAYLNITIQIGLFSDISLQLFLISLWVGVTLLAGLYPSFVMSGYRPVQVLKNMITVQNSGKFSLRRVLVIFQLTISFTYVFGTMILLKQLDFMKYSDPGFATEGIVVLQIPEQNLNKSNRLKLELSKLNEVDNVSLSNTLPLSHTTSTTSIRVSGYAETFSTNMKFVDNDYLKLYDMPLLAGEPLLDTDSISSIIVNKEWVEMVGLSDPQEAVGLILTVWGETAPVKGVIDDFHSSSMKTKIPPMILVSYPDYNIASVALSTAKLSQSVAVLESTWKSIYPEYDFLYSFVDDQLAQMYVREEKMFGITLFFSIITIAIACIGLFGLASFMVNRKVKEVGVRRVMGATVSQIVGLFSKEFLRLIGISFIIAAPLIWYAMNLWLNSFEYKTTIDFSLFLNGIILITLISLITVVVPTIKAAMANPAESLRSE